MYWVVLGIGCSGVHTGRKAKLTYSSTVHSLSLSTHNCTYYCTSGLMNRDRRKECECLSLAAFHLNKGDVVLGIVITLLHAR